MAVVCGGVRYNKKATGMARIKRKAKKKRSKRRK
tara:strand:+ start:378 stop:479 length:102 start_codon:yes stop_codon:yes gene_type:complete